MSPQHLAQPARVDLSTPPRRNPQHDPRLHTPRNTRQTPPSDARPKEGRLARCAPLPVDLSLLLVSRQIYTETRLLPFKLNAFQIKPEYLRTFLNKLANAQRDTLTTSWVPRLSIKSTDDFHSLTEMPLLQDDARAGLLALSRMRGLTCVDHHDWHSWIQEHTWNPCSDKHMSAWIRHCVGDWDMDMFPVPPPFLVALF
jgi:hypothetical protein